MRARFVAWMALLACLGPTGHAADAPPVPPGLDAPGSSGRPANPEQPDLPEGLSGSIEPSGESDEAPGSDFAASGFIDARAGTRTQDDPLEKQTSLAETRLQLHLEGGNGRTEFRFTGDFLYDDVTDERAIDLEDGAGAIDLREAALLFRPADFVDIKAGRQILTWGTGDLIFVNDLFPKDFRSLFIGRDEEYLKAPSDAIKTSLFSAPVNLDVVYTPRFDADRFIDGRRVSFFDPARDERVGRRDQLDVAKPDDWFDDDEIALRLYNNVAGYELAGYFYHGFWKSPAGQDPVTGEATFPPLSVYGMSVRGPLGAGIGNLELGYYDSRDDRDGDDPLVRNSEIRALLGYEQELARDFTAGFQYALEHVLEHDDLRRTLPAGGTKPDENRHLLTLRLTQLWLNQNLSLSLFGFYSPSDDDCYVLPRIKYKVTDAFSVETGANVFFGRDRDTFFGQLDDNSNVYVGLRYGFASFVSR